MWGIFKLLLAILGIWILDITGLLPWWFWLVWLVLFIAYLLLWEKPRSEASSPGGSTDTADPKVPRAPAKGPR